LVVDHFGKDPSAGLRGTSAKETNPLFILNTSEQQKDLHAERHLEIRKMRNGPAQMAVSFWMKEKTVEVQQIVRNEDTGIAAVEPADVSTLYIEWGEDLRPVVDGERVKGSARSGGASQQALQILGQLINEQGVPLPAGLAPAGLLGVAMETWRQKLL